MRARKWRGTVWAAWLGLLALALNSLVPIHVAFDLAEALGPAHHRSAHTYADAAGADRHLLALLVGHRHSGGKSHDHGKGHGTACPVCSALGALTGLASPAPVVLPAPDGIGLAAALPIVRSKPVATSTGYRSRAPPIV
jgi:Protein of unknown function (DUF2946)